MKNKNESSGNSQWEKVKTCAVIFTAIVNIGGLGLRVYKECRKRKDLAEKKQEQREKEARQKAEQLEKERRAREEKERQEAARRNLAELKQKQKLEIIKTRHEYTIETVEFRHNLLQNIKSYSSTIVTPSNSGCLVYQANAVYSMPTFIQMVNSGLPIRAWYAVSMALLCGFGAFAFSRVRAKYTDGNLKAPTMQVVVMGPSGSGKTQIVKEAFNKVFKPFIDRDSDKMSQVLMPDSPQYIVQCNSGEMTKPMFQRHAYLNSCAHLILVNDEVGGLRKKIDDGIGFDGLRIGYEGGEIVVNKQTDLPNGRYTTNISHLFIGTPGQINTLYKGHETDGSTGRVIWAYVPQRDGNEAIEWPDEADLSGLHNYIQECAKKYVYTTEPAPCNDDKPSDITEVDLEYVFPALDKWEMEQLLKNELSRNAFLSRVKESAFRAAIVLHMLFGQPTDKNTQATIASLAVAIADSTIEQLIAQCGSEWAVSEFNNEDRLAHLFQSPSAASAQPSDAAGTIIVDDYGKGSYNCAQRLTVASVKGEPHVEYQDLPVDGYVIYGKRHIPCAKVVEMMQKKKAGATQEALLKEYGEEYNIKYREEISRIFENYKKTRLVK